MTTQMQMPENIQIEDVNGPYHSRFILNPLEEGYGVTIGNAFRRVLLSSIYGHAIIGVKISTVLHEFQTIPGVVEDMVEVVLNLKEVRMRVTDPKINRITLVKKGAGEWTAGDLENSSLGVEILNPSRKIATLAADADFDVELRIGYGKGYVPAEDQPSADFPVGMLPIDAIFTPIKNVVFQVEPFRVGQKTDYEKLVLEVTTDGSVTTRAAIENGADILRSHIMLFLGTRKYSSSDGLDGDGHHPVDERDRLRAILTRSVDNLELSVRAHNCLKAANIKTLGDLVSLEETDLLKFRNFGRKSLAELAEVVVANGLTFGMDVEMWLREEPKAE